MDIIQDTIDGLKIAVEVASTKEELKELVNHTIYILEIIVDSQNQTQEALVKAQATIAGQK
jgi:hypothetical protein